MASIGNTSKLQPRNFQISFQPIQYFSRCIGLWPFTVAYDSNGLIKEARVHLFDKLWFLISICLYLTALFHTYKNSLKSQDLKAKFFFSTLIFKIYQIPPLFFGTIGIVLDMYNRNRLVDILNKIAIFDREV